MATLFHDVGIVDAPVLGFGDEPGGRALEDAGAAYATIVRRTTAIAKLAIAEALLDLRDGEADPTKHRKVTVTLKAIRRRIAALTNRLARISANIRAPLKRSGLDDELRHVAVRNLRGGGVVPTRKPDGRCGHDRPAEWCAHNGTFRAPRR